MLSDTRVTWWRWLESMFGIGLGSTEVLNREPFPTLRASEQHDQLITAIWEDWNAALRSVVEKLLLRCWKYFLRNVLVPQASLHIFTTALCQPSLWLRDKHMKMQVDILWDDGEPLWDAPEMVVMNPGAPSGTIYHPHVRFPTDHPLKSCAEVLWWLWHYNMTFRVGKIQEPDADLWSIAKHQGVCEELWLQIGYRLYGPYLLSF